MFNKKNLARLKIKNKSTITPLLSLKIITTALLLLITSATSAAEKAQILETLTLKKSDKSELNLSGLTAQVWSDGNIVVSGKGEYPVSAPTYVVKYQVNLKDKTYTAKNIDPSVLKLEEKTQPQESINRVNSNPKVLNLSNPKKIQSTSTGYYTARVMVRAYDPVNIKLTETSNRLNWYVYSNGTVDWTSYQLNWWSANPTSLGTHWYISSTSHSGPYPVANSTQVYHNMTGNYYNYDFVFPNWITTVKQFAAITGNNNATFGYSWSHSDDGEGNWLITGWLVLN